MEEYFKHNSVKPI